MVGRVLFLRHAETPWNGARRWQGWADVSLTKLGRKQTHTLGVHLKDLDIDALFSLINGGAPVRPTVSTQLHR